LRLETLELKHVTNAGLAELPAWPELIKVALHGRRFTDDGLRHFAGLPELVDLSMDGTAINGSGLRYLSRLPKLTRLSLNGTSLTDANSHFLGALVHLEYLDLSNTPITDAGTACLRKLKNLKVLRLRGTAVTADCLANVAGLPFFRYLTFDKPLDDEAVGHLAAFPSLDMCGNGSLVSLRNCYLTDAGLADVAKLEFLRSLGLHDACEGRDIAGIDIPPESETMTDAGLARLWSMPRLEYVSISGRDITMASLNWIPDEPNHCNVQFNFRRPPAEAFVESLDVGVTSMKMEHDRLTMACEEAIGPREIVAVFPKGRCDLGILEYVPGLKHLRVEDWGVGCAWSKLRFLPELETLRLPAGYRPVPMNAVGLLVLGNMKNLCSLRCQFVGGLQADHWGFLSRLSNLTIVDVRSQDFTGEHLRLFTGLQQLNTLRLRAPPRTVDDEHGLKCVAGLPNLEFLSLRGCTDVGMRYVGQMKKLNSLDISGDITDEGLKQLHELPMLNSVHLLDPGITDGGIAEFRRRQPGVTLIYKDPSTHEGRFLHGQRPAE
jgi:hypothetical protein